MKKAFVLLLVLMMFAGACFVAGCGGCGCDNECPEVQETHPNGEKKPHVETVLDFPNEEKIGLPLYKNAGDDFFKYWAGTAVILQTVYCIWL